MFRRQKPPSVPVKPETDSPEATSGGTPGFRTAEPAVAAPAEPQSGVFSPSSAYADPAIGSAAADTGSDTSARPMMNTPFSSTNPITGTGTLGAAGKTEIPRRVVEIPGAPPRRATPTESAGSSEPAEMRKLIVGRDISLSGEIAACDVLVVEGTVEAKLRDGRTIEIADTGLFKGSVEIDDADIGGRFEGDITVRGTLKVRATGKIQGNIRYGTLEVENGGQLSGSIEVLTGGMAKPAATVASATPAPAPLLTESLIVE